MKKLIEDQFDYTNTSFDAQEDLVYYLKMETYENKVDAFFNKETTSTDVKDKDGNIIYFGDIIAAKEALKKLQNKYDKQYKFSIQGFYKSNLPKNTKIRGTNMLDEKIFLQKKNHINENVLDFNKIKVSQSADEQLREQLNRHEVNSIKNYNGNETRLFEKHYLPDTEWEWQGDMIDYGFDLIDFGKDWCKYEFKFKNGRRSVTDLTKAIMEISDMMNEQVKFEFAYPNVYDVDTAPTHLELFDPEVDSEDKMISIEERLRDFAKYAGNVYFEMFMEFDEDIFELNSKQGQFEFMDEPISNQWKESKLHEDRLDDLASDYLYDDEYEDEEDYYDDIEANEFDSLDDDSDEIDDIYNDSYFDEDSSELYSDMGDDYEDSTDIYESLENEENKLDEANRIYKYKVGLEQPEGGKFYLRRETKFKTKEEAEQIVAAWNLNMSQKAKDAGCKFVVEEIEDKPRRKSPKTSDNPDFNNPFVVGDILYGDVGYSMSIPEFWEVVKVTPQYVTCKMLQTKNVTSDGYSSGTMAPVEGVYAHNRNYGAKTDYVEERMQVRKFGTSGDPYQDYSAWLNRRYRFAKWDGEAKWFDYND